MAVHPHTDLYGSDRMFLEGVAAFAPGVLAVLPQPGPLVDALAERDVAHLLRPFPVLRKVELRSPWRVLVFGVRFLRSLGAQTRWLRRERPAVLYVSTVAAPQWLLAGRLAGVRVVCHVHESEPQWPRLASTVLLSPLWAAQAVVANSRDCLGWIRSALGDRIARRTRVVHNGVREPQPPATTAPAAAGPRRLVVVGRLSERKGQDVAVAATALVREAGHDVTLTLVGDSYPGYEHVEEGLRVQARDLGVADATVFTGFCDPAPHVAAADVVLVPSRVEPFGLVAVEGMLHGRPVVVSAVGGLPEVVRDGETGLLVRPDDPRALADAVLRLLTDTELATALGAAGRADARARFSLPAYAAALRDAVLPGRSTADVSA
ncbi:glycosyltransferase family 1 protein [Blastococcus sp. TF02A-26]|nr:glycosyltransferase family 1 protein [Blastococcus sp. TF02A-26]